MCMEKNTVSWEHINIKHITVKMPPYCQTMYSLCFLKPGNSFIHYKCQNDQSFKSVQSITMRAIIRKCQQANECFFSLLSDPWISLNESILLFQPPTIPHPEGQNTGRLFFFLFSFLDSSPRVCVCVGVLSFVTPMLLSDTWMKVLFRLCAAATTISETRARSLTGFPPNEHHQFFFISQGAQAQP